MRGKRGDYPYYVIISIILGLIVLGLAAYLIFNEFFEDGVADDEICRQSIVLRAKSPEVRKWGMSFETLKDKFPLRCKTTVRTVDETEIDRLDEIIGEELISCWNLFGNGDYDIFPVDAGAFYEGFYQGYATYGIPCARIHLTEEAKKSLREKLVDNYKKEFGDNIEVSSVITLDFYKQLEQKQFSGSKVSYLHYLRDAGKDFDPLNPGFMNLFIPSAGGFEVDETLEMISAEPRTKEGPQDSWVFDGAFSQVRLPRGFLPQAGDLIINYGALAVWKGAKTPEEKERLNIPFLFYYQVDQVPNPYEQFNKGFLKTNFASQIPGLGIILEKGAKFIEHWEGIPV